MRKLFLFLALFVGVSTSVAGPIEVGRNMPSTSYVCGSEKSAEKLVYGLSLMDNYQFAGYEVPNRYVKESWCLIGIPSEKGMKRVREYRILLQNNHWAQFHIDKLVWKKRNYFYVTSTVLAGEEI